jgi:hypothetical protein
MLRSPSPHIRRMGAFFLLTPLALTGCVSAVVDGAIRGAIEAMPPSVQQFIAENSDISLEMPLGTEIPADWPQAVLIPEGDVVFSYADADVWNLALSLADADAAIAGADRLQANGFGVVSEQDIQEMRLIQLTNGEWDVDYAWLADDQATVVNITVRATSP